MRVFFAVSLFAAFLIAMAALNLPALDDFQPWMKWLGVAAILIPSLFAVFIAMGVGKKPQRSSDWWRLRDAILDITISYQPIIRLKTVSTIPAVSREEKLEWLMSVRAKLDSQIDNKVLLSDDDALAHWRQAQTTARMATDLQGNLSESILDGMTNSLMSDVMAVFVNKIFNSREPGSGFGPKPQPISPAKA